MSDAAREREARAEPARIYLAGPVGAYADGGADWRNQVQEHFAEDYDFRDPLSKYNIPAGDLDVVDGISNPDNPETVGVEEIVKNDKRLIDESDGLVVGYTQVYSIGTPMEVMYAREREMPVAIWVRDDTEFDDLSPWYRHHATALTTDVEMGLRHIESQALEEVADA